MRENMEFPTEWVIVSEDDESSESPQSQAPPPSPPVDEEDDEADADAQVLQAYIVTAGG